MSLIQECLEAFGAFSGMGNQRFSDFNSDMYPIESAAVIINMESTLALNEIYEMNDAIECASVHAVYDAKRLGIPVEESFGDKMKSLGNKIADIWAKIKKFFIDLKNKIVGWFKKMRDKVKEFFGKVTAGFKKTPPDMKITVHGEEIIVSRGDVETMVKDRDNAVRMQTYNKGQADKYHAAATRLGAEKAKDKAEANRKIRELEDKNKDQAAIIRRLTIKTYNFSALDEIGEGIEDTYEYCKSGDLTKNIEKEIEIRINYINSETNRARVFKDKKQSKAASDVAKVVMDDVADLLKRIFNINGVDFKNDPPEVFRQAVWSYIRDGAHSDEDKVLLTSLPLFRGKLDITDIIKEEVDRLNPKIAEFSKISKAVADMFDSIISQIDGWANQVKDPANVPSQSGTVTEGMTELNTALTEYSKAYSKMQSFMNIVISEWFNGMIEWTKVLNSFTM